MKLPEQENTTTIQSADFESSEIGVSQEDGQEIAYILRDKIYSDKPLAVVREYLANALDEHAKVKESDPSFDKKVKVCLPDSNDSSPFISFRDFAYGLDDSGVRNIFGMYLKSTKRQTDKLIGGFGVGSKSGHAYTDTFYVTSWHGGKKRVYSFSLQGGSRSKAKILLVDEKDSDEPSGIEVKVPILHQDIYKFKRSFEEFYPFVKNLVEINLDEETFSFPFGEVQYVEPSYVKMSEAMINRVLCGFIPYRMSENVMVKVYSEVKNELLGEGFSSEDISCIKRILFGGYGFDAAHKFIPRVKIKDVDISISRENLETTDRTEAAIKASVKDAIKKEFKKFKEALEEIEDAKPFLEFCVENSWTNFTAQLEKYCPFYKKLKKTFDHAEKEMGDRVKASRLYMRSFYRQRKRYYEPMKSAFNINMVDIINAVIDQRRYKFLFDFDFDYSLGKSALHNRYRSIFAETVGSKDNEGCNVVFFGIDKIKKYENEEEKEEQEFVERVLTKFVKKINKAFDVELFERKQKGFNEYKPMSSKVYESSFMGEEGDLSYQDALYKFNLLDGELERVEFSEFPQNGVLTYAKEFYSRTSAASDEESVYISYLDICASLKVTDGGGEYIDHSYLESILNDLGVGIVYVCRRSKGIKLKKKDPLFVDELIEQEFEKKKIELKKEFGKSMSAFYNNKFYSERLSKFHAFNKFLRERGIAEPKTNLGEEEDSIHIYLKDAIASFDKKRLFLYLIDNKKEFRDFANKSFERAKTKSATKAFQVVSEYKKEVFSDPELLKNLKLFICANLYSEKIKSRCYYSSRGSNISDFAKKVDEISSEKELDKV